MKLRIELLLRHNQRSPLRWFEHLTPLSRQLEADPEEIWIWRDYESSLAWERPGIPQGEAGKYYWGEQRLMFFPKSVSSITQTIVQMFINLLLDHC